MAIPRAPPDTGFGDEEFETVEQTESQWLLFRTLVRKRFEVSTDLAASNRRSSLTSDQGTPSVICPI